jgi:hypothetical protein
MDAYRIPLQLLGYSHVPHGDDAFCPFFHCPGEWPHTRRMQMRKASSLNASSGWLDHKAILMAFPLLWPDALSQRSAGLCSLNSFFAFYLVAHRRARPTLTLEDATRGGSR